MKLKSVLTGFIAGGAVSAGLLMPSVAHAGTSIRYSPTTIDVAGGEVSLPQHIVAIDPWSGKPTSWVPVWYLQQALKIEGVYTTWNGSTLDVTSIPWGVDLSAAAKTGTPPTGEMQFSINGNQNDFVRAPKLVADAPYTTIPTTYVTVYYANKFLQQRLLMGVAWKDNTWSMASPRDVNTIILGATPSNVDVGQSVTISGEYRLAGNLGGPDVLLTVYGLPNTKVKTLTTNSEGRFSFSTTFEKAGTYTVTVRSAMDTRQINITVR
ncbi:carboxypeptidase regulatory-like domain-containing protein [Alicyclobacillus mengziensis]|uniref:Carboxypeptidase regulatory-like domain-containing protein n=1 Tax=Alicyclobacillus mengziensis TaxID=2931921 RepID=A0A9X7VYJ9_9BACL|nr:carboxypeptidase regulatory-like domain-containing protein [Alicyclobacillus mengziensis]QSO47471.1 carboxypeptidase regulatory-like domain-containing protein [Alicyclobacillus mengziensis]